MLVYELAQNAGIILPDEQASSSPFSTVPQVQLIARSSALARFPNAKHNAGRESESSRVGLRREVVVGTEVEKF